MDFAHYYRTEEKVGTGDFVFRRYSSKPLEDKNRFVQLIEGSLEEITAEDWGNITVIPSYSVYNGALELYRKYYSIDVLKKIEIPDSVITVNKDSLVTRSVTEVVFSSNIKFIYDGVCQYTGSNCVIDFSKAKAIPSRYANSDGNYFSFLASNIAQIKVPSALASAWKNRNDWSNLADKIISV